MHVCAANHTHRPAIRVFRSQELQDLSVANGARRVARVWQHPEPKQLLRLLEDPLNHLTVWGHACRNYAVLCKFMFFRDGTQEGHMDCAGASEDALQYSYHLFASQVDLAVEIDPGPVEEKTPA